MRQMSYAAMVAGQTFGTIAPTGASEKIPDVPLHSEEEKRKSNVRCGFGFGGKHKNIELQVYADVLRSCRRWNAVE